MRVRVTKSFLWAPNGTHVREVAVGEVLDGRGAEVALELKSGELLEQPAEQLPASSEPSSTPEAEPEAAAEPPAAPAPASHPHKKRK